MSTTPPRRGKRAYTHGPHIYQRGPSRTWYAYTEQWPKGKSLGTTDRAEAERQFRTLLTEGNAARGVGRAAEEPLIRCVEAFLSAPHGYTRRTLGSHRERLTMIGKALALRGVEYPSEITPGILDAWLEERGKTRARPTINRDIRTLKVCLRWCASRGMCLPSPAVVDRPALREPLRSVRHVVPDPAEMRRILAELETIHFGTARAVRCLYATGMRIEELLRLRATDLRGDSIHVSPETGSMRDAEPGKGYRDRSIRLAPVAREAVVAWFAYIASRDHRTVSDHWMRTKLHAACHAARVEPCGFHDLRRAFATEMARAGVDLIVIAKWLGHRLVSTTERYLAEYRSDRKIQAPVPGGLEGAESLQKAGVVSGAFGSSRGASEKSERPKK